MEIICVVVDGLAVDLVRVAVRCGAPNPALSPPVGVLPRRGVLKRLYGVVRGILLRGSMP